MNHQPHNLHHAHGEGSPLTDAVRSPVHKRLVVIGAGGNLYDLLDTMEAVNATVPTWDVVGVLDDQRHAGDDYLGIRVLGPLSNAANLGDCSFISGIWNEKVCRVLHEVLARTRLNKSSFATLIHPKSFVSTRAKLAQGVIIHHAASIAGNVTLGEHVSIGPGCTIGHDTNITGFTAIAAGAVIGGGVQVGRNCYIGSGSMIRQNISIGEGAVIGMGAVVVNNIPPGATVAGNPARPVVSSHNHLIL